MYIELLHIYADILTHCKYIYAQWSCVGNKLSSNSAFMKCKGTICSNIQIHLTILKIIFQIHTDLLIISSGLNIHEWAYNCKVTHYTWSANAKYMDKNCVIFINILCKMKSWRNNQW